MNLKNLYASEPFSGRGLPPFEKGGQGGFVVGMNMKPPLGPPFSKGEVKQCNAHLRIVQRHKNLSPVIARRAPMREVFSAVIASAAKQSRMSRFRRAFPSRPFASFADKPLIKSLPLCLCASVVRGFA